MPIDVAAKYGLDTTGATDNAVKLAQLSADIAVCYTAQKPMPRLVFREGIVSFSVWPDLAYPDLQIVAEGQCQLKYTGAADGIVFDASRRNPAAQQPGIRNLTFTGFDILPAAKGAPLTFMGIHRSNISVRVLSGTNDRAAIQILFCIITKIHPVVESGHSAGLWMDAWPGKPNLQTTACTIENPCLEGCATGIYWANAGSCVAYGGTIESCGVGVQLGPNAGNNMHYSVEMEGNGADVQETSGSKANGFLYCGNNSKLNTKFSAFSSNWSKN